VIITQANSDDLFAQAATQLRSLESRLETAIAVAESIVRGSDPETADGREARAMLKRLRRMRDGIGQALDEDE
jgi:hypothetical protein